MPPGDGVDPRDARPLRSSIPSEPFAIITAFGRWALKTIALIVHVQRRVRGERIMLLNHGRIQRAHQHLALSRMGCQYDKAISHRQLEVIQIGWTAARWRRDPRALRLPGFRIVIGEQRASARIAQHHDAFESPLLAKKPDSSRRSI